jgi:transposase-like protein
VKQLLLLPHACNLRNLGYSYKEIATKIGVSKSTAHLWTKEVKLSSEGSVRLQSRFLFGQVNSQVTQGRLKKQKLDMIWEEQQTYLAKLSNVPDKLLCALIYWCEGAKDRTAVLFTNSDPKLARTFIKLFRNSFNLDESKFRVVIHLHEYHDEATQKKFWSKVTHVPISQFSKCYRKPHTGKVKRENYPGCIQIRYYDAKVAKILLILAEAFMKSRYGGVG